MNPYSWPIPEEKFEQQKAYIAPLLTKNFPSVETLLKKYDLNHDDGLDVAELRKLAEDLHR